MFFRRKFVKIASVSSNLVISVLCDVSHPRKSLVTTFLDNFKISDLDATNCEIWYLELYLNWDLLVLLSLLILNWWEAELRSHVELLSTGELLNTPDHAAFIGDVFNSSDIWLEHRRINIDRHRNDDLNVICYGFLLKLCSRFDNEFYFGLGVILDNSFHPYERLYVGVNAICHQFELSVRRYESDEALRLEFVKSNALMELDIL